MPRRLSFVRLSMFQQPLLFPTISFICGLTFAARREDSVGVWLVPCFVAWLFALAWLYINRSNVVVITFLAPGFFCAGGVLWTINENSASDINVRKLLERGQLKIGEPVAVDGRLNAAPELAPDRIYLVIEIEKAATLGLEIPASGALQVVVPFVDGQSRIEYDSLKLDYGTRLRALVHLSNHRGYRNPGAPDFSRLLEYRGYHATGWVKSPLLIERLGEGKRNRFLSKLYQARSRALIIILRQFRQPASGILAAALFGNRYFLSRETAEIFRAGGTFHLLVISGLHITMIAVSALWLTKYLINSRALRYALVLVLMWAYALMVGAQPAVTRSVVMLSIVLIGQLIFRTSAGGNTLAASAIVLLAWQPRDIFNPGFQLSFLTVSMIVIFTGPLYTRVKRIGEWQPSRLTPYPPRISIPVKRLSELLFWDERQFRKEMKESRIRFRLSKSRVIDELRCRKPIAWIAVTIFTTIGVQLGLLPLMVAQFHRVSIVSPVTNVIEGALIFLLMIAGAVYLIVHSIAGSMSLNLAGLVNALGVFTVVSCEPLLAWRGASLRVADFGELSIAINTLYFIAVAALIIVINEWNPMLKGDEPSVIKLRIFGRILAAVSTLTILFLSYLFTAHPFAHEYEQGRLSITFLDVGQGDAMLISFPNGSLMMLDAGGRAGNWNRNRSQENEDIFIEDRIGIAEAAVMPYLWHRGIKRLDWIVASHADSDHVEGFAEIVRSFDIDMVMKGMGQSPANSFNQMIAKSKLPQQIVKRGDELEIDGVWVKVLSPFAGDGELPLSDNNGSIVLKIGFGDRSFLLTGDIEKEAEARLVDSAGDLSADVLKVAHHGSKTSTTSAFLERVKPRHAVISAANPSPFGHPHAEVVARLEDNGVQIRQTSACGAITFSTDGRDLRVDTFVKCE